VAARLIRPTAIPTCHLLQFDNVATSPRDNPNVPSDLEQMPHLLNFIEKQRRNALQSPYSTHFHTGTDILTAITGLYGDHMECLSVTLPVFNANGTSSSTPAFAYWTDLIPNGTYNMLSAPNTNAPAPWFPIQERVQCGRGSHRQYRAGKRWSDVDTVFGPNSPQHQEAQQNPPQAIRDFEGIAVHCAQGERAAQPRTRGCPICCPASRWVFGYQGLFGHEYVAPIISRMDRCSI